MISLFSVCLILMPSTTSDLPVGDEWFYEIELSPEQGDLPAVQATLEVLCVASDSERHDCVWHLIQSDDLAVPFPGRFGKWDYDRRTGSVEQPASQISLAYEGRVYRIQFPVPFVSIPEEAGVGTRWTLSGAEWELDAQETRDGVDCARIRIEGAFGRVITIWLERETGRVIEGEQTVFVGQGIPYRMKYRMDVSRTLSDAALNEALPGLDQLLTLFESARPDAEIEDWAPSNEQRESISASLETMPESPQSEIFANLLDDARRSLDSESRRARSIEQLRNRIVGKPLPDEVLETLEGDRFDFADSKGKVVVLHFWGYRNENLDPPYGQVGFLDFLARRIDLDSVAVVGVAEVSAEDDAQRRAQTRSVKKFTEFMNLSYPVMLDRGSLLRGVGDPRVVRETLPLWVIVDKEGNVTHYQPGLFELDARQGLRQLEELIEKAQAADE